MPSISLTELNHYMQSALLKSGLNQDHANWMCEVFMRATLRGVGHHDIFSFPGRLKNLSDGTLNPTPQFSLTAQYQALESYEGDNAPGEVASMFILERAERLAEQHGMGFCAIRHSNHFLAAAPYVEKAAEDGFIAILYTRGAPAMSAAGRTDKAISTCPMGFAFPTDQNYPVMMDFCLAYASMGLLDEKIKSGQSVPSYWGLDPSGNPSSDPAAIKAGTRAPIGGHKGFGLSMLGEVFTGVLSGGEVIDETDPLSGKSNCASQAALLIKADGLMPLDQFKARTGDMLERIEARAPGLHIPGQGSHKSKQAFQAQGSIDLPVDLLEKLNTWADRLSITRLPGG